MHKIQCILILFLLSLMHGGIAHAQWVQTNGPYGGTILSFAVSGTNLFAGTNDDGVFLSTDNGTCWTAVNNGLTNTNVRALAVSPNGAGGTNLFAGTYGGGVFLSTKNGTSWSAVNTGLTGTSVFALAVSPNEAGGTNLFAGTYGGVFLSTNNGTACISVIPGVLHADCDEELVNTKRGMPDGMPHVSMYIECLMLLHQQHLPRLNKVTRLEPI